jgi:integrase
VLYQQYYGTEAIYAAYFEFAFFSGMRPSEMLALRWSDIDSRRDYVRVSKARSKGRLNERTLHALEIAHSITYQTDGPVFLSPRRGLEFKTERAPREIFNERLKQLDIRHRPAYNTRRCC